MTNKFDFEKIFEKYKYMVYHIAFTLLQNHHSAEDTMILVFEKLFCSRINFETEDDIRYWLTTVTKNLAIDMIRRSGKEKSSDFLQEMPDCKNDPANIVTENEIVNVIRSLLPQMKEKYATVLRLYFFENRTLAEVAKILNLPVGTVCSRYNRGKNMIAKELKKRGYKNFTTGRDE